MSSEIEDCKVTFAEVKSRLEDIEKELADKLYIKENIRQELIQRAKANQLEEDELVSEWLCTYASYLSSVSFNDQIDAYKQELKSVSIEDDEVFYKIIQKSLFFLDKNDLRRKFDLSKLGLERWLNKKNAPHPAIRKHVFNFLIKQLDSIS